MKLILQNLTKKFPNRGKKAQGDVTAVNDVNIEIPDGELVGLLGPSGCGKSTTLFMICGLLTPSSGKIYFGEEDVTALPPEKRGVGVVFQNYALYPHMTVRQNIMFPLQNRKGADKMSKEELNRATVEAAKLVQMEELLDRKPSELSGGQQQRVAIARAMVKMPKVLLLDEPLSNLDARLRLQTREEIRRIQRETGITTVFVTHDQEEAMSISDRIVVMREGVVQQMGKPQDVYDDPVNLFVAKFLGTPPINLFDGKVKDGKLYVGEDAVLSIQEIAAETAAANFVDNANFSTQAETVLQKDYNKDYVAVLESSRLNKEKRLDHNDEAENEVKSRSGRVGNESISNLSRMANGSINRNTLADMDSKEVTVGIRPEGFVVDPAGPLCCNLSGVEVMGRDTSIVSTHPASQGSSIRSIVDAQSAVNVNVASQQVRFSLKPDKVLLFDKETERRIYGSK